LKLSTTDLDIISDFFCVSSRIDLNELELSAFCLAMTKSASHYAQMCSGDLTMKCSVSIIDSQKALIRMLITGFILVVALSILFPCSSMAQGSNIARDLANPFANLWSIVNQINFNQISGGLFKESHTEFNWNLQPVTPIPLTDQFNLVNRPVFAYYKTPYVDLTGQLSYSSGLGDTIFASLIVPNKSEGIIWGLGVTFIAPTAGDSIHIGQGLWQAGPTAGLFYVSKQFVAGVFPQQWQSVSGADLEHPGTRHMNLQYAISYLPTPELTIASSANILADWTKDEANRCP
jgi:hypothetical protein